MSAVTGTPILVRASIRQDARNIGPWVVLISVLSATSIMIYRWIFTSHTERAELSASLGINPALALIFGRARDLMTADGFNAWRAGSLGAFFAGLMAVLIVVRNSRAQEDSGQAELLASGVMGRETRLLTAVLMSTVASVWLGVFCFLLTWAFGGGVAATAMLSLGFTAAGLIFTGVAAVTSQLGSDARSASALAVATLGLLYVVRGYIDSSDSPSWASWLTPFGWIERTEPGGANDPWPLLAALGLAIVLVVAAFVLQARRDFGQGLVPQRPGPAAGGRSQTIWKLARQLNQGSMVGWLLAFALLGVLFGNLVTSLGAVMAKNPAAAKLLASGAVSASDLTAAFVATVLQIIGIIAAVQGVQVIMRIWAEESDYRVEPLLAGSVRRPAYLFSNLLVALVATAMGMTLAGIGLGFVAHHHDPSLSVGDVVLQALVTVPAVWVLVALATAAIGAKPSRRLVGWLGVLATFGLTLLGPTFKLPDYILTISPLRHVPTIMSSSPDWPTLGWLGLALAVFLGVGFAGFRRRDVI